MLKSFKIMLLSLLLLGFIVGLKGQAKITKTASPQLAPKKVLLINDFIRVNSKDTIYVQTIQFPLMTDNERVFVTKRISDYRSSKIKLFIDAFYNRDRVQDQYFQDVSYSQNWRCEIVYQSQTELSMQLFNYEFTGGAHGNTSVKNFNFDLKNLKSYTFNDKFNRLDITKVAEYCTNYCATNNIPIFEDAIKPSPQLLNIWNFTNQGLLLTFPQYTIAPYSSGLIQIHIPNEELKKMTLIK